MYLLDTNILSELMRPTPNRGVINWLDQQFSNDLYISSITIAEIHLGIALLPDGKRRKTLKLAADLALQDFAENQLDFSEQSAIEYANIVAKRTKGGRPINVEDAQIASIALVNKANLVTRNVNDFDLIDGLNIINPFD
ncbi:MAG: VapC toxin family PIN domain ribonuclease [Aquificaceae bacterium]|nr:MAG: VapC toxin family PIN domain ribonuclease [Aquificaceae bacterium]